VVPVVARDLGIDSLAGLAMDASGNTYAAGILAVRGAVNFQTAPGGAPILLDSSGAQDIFVAKYDLAGNIAWGGCSASACPYVIGDDDPTQVTDQTATGIAVNGGGHLAVVGKITGEVTFGTQKVVSANGIAFIASLAASDGARLWGKGYDLGANGLFARVAASPTGSSKRFAACGQTNKTGTNALTGATYGGLQDAVIAVFADDGTKLWAVQLASTGNELCNAVAIDENGDVLAAGQFDGASLAFPGGPTLTGPGTTARKFMWVAKFNGATGASLAAVEFHGASGAILPQTAAVDANGDWFVAGNYTGQPVFGSTTLTNAGSDDAFVAKLERATLAPLVAPARIGGNGSDSVKGLATTSAGDVVATGNLYPSTGGAPSTGAAALTPAGSSANDQLVLKLNGSTLATQGAAVYGDAAAQDARAVVVNRFGTGTARDAVTFGGQLTGSVTYGVGLSITNSGIGSLGGEAPDAVLVFGKVQ
jgi:hypothetical protein